MADLACALHVHSRHSDGSGTIAEIAQAAQAAGVDVLIVTDHDTLAGRPEEGMHGRTLVLVETELSPKRRDHYLALGLPAEVAHDGMDAFAMCAAVEQAGGFGFAAHPFSTGSRIPIVDRFAQPQRWADLERPCITGIEIWNVETEGAERARSPRALASFARDPLAQFGEPNPDVLAEWDRLGRQRRVVGIAGLDAHQKGLRLGGHVLSPLPYAALFRHVRTHLLTASEPNGELDHDRALVHEALREGRCYVAVDEVAPARGFRFSARAAGGAELPMGAEADAGGWTIVAQLPRRASLTLLRDGQPVATAAAERLEAAAGEPGVYRLEARIDGRLWILSNPVYLRAGA